MYLLKGKKTYLIAAVLFILGGLQATGNIDKQTYETIAAFLLPAGLATLRSGVKK